MANTRTIDLERAGISAVFKPRSRMDRWKHGIWHFVRTKPLGTIGAALVLLIIGVAIFAPQIAPYGFDHRIIADRLQGPTAKHPLGTDELGRDMLSRIVYGARIATFVGFGVVIIANVLAALIGIISGYIGGWVDTLLQRFIDMWIAFPGLVLLLAVIAVLGTPTSVLQVGPLAFDTSQQRAAQIVVVLGVLFSTGASRVIRGATLAVRNNLYVEGARTVGASDTRIVLTYILPNVLPTIIILASLGLGAAILTEASLSFLGFGIPEPVPDWGRMVSGIALARARTDAWLAFWPGLAITLAVFGFNMLGDALRDVLDPRLRGGK
jgi:peptide/nickel transport system permease protein